MLQKDMAGRNDVAAAGFGVRDAYVDRVILHGSFCAPVINPAAGGTITHANPESKNELFGAL